MSLLKMDPLPPNDPNNNNNRIGREKEAPHDGRQRNGSENMDVIGDMREQPLVVAMFLVGVASWFLRQQCTC